jgi:hypothetical protein
LAFSPKGLRLGVARYNGATLHFPATDGKPVELQWDGAHTGITFSPDAAFLVTTMQENALHGWKLADGKHMRMSGYPAKVKSISWSARVNGWPVPARRRRLSGRFNPRTDLWARRRSNSARAAT